MIRFVCGPQRNFPEACEEGVEYISLYESGALHPFEIGDVALSLQSEVRRAGLSPSIVAWDFCSIAMAVAAADESAPREISPDGWTREIEMEVHLHEPLIWQGQRTRLEKTLRFLTGDFWKISFVEGGEGPPKPRQEKSYDANCVALLSGGVDSMVGAVDLRAGGHTPMFVSKLVRGDKDIQCETALLLSSASNHLQWSYGSRSPGKGEGSTRGRSIIFFAYAVLAASAIDMGSDQKVPIYVPENGFISLNVPLTPGRMGSLSTKTTHPVYLGGLQEVWDSVGIQAELKSPLDYCFKTKGEIVAGCKDPNLLGELVGRSTSCGRFLTYKMTHCGRCVPCLVRRAAFLHAGIPDPTVPSRVTSKSYRFENLAAAMKDGSSSDVRSVATALIRMQNRGLESVIGGALAFADSDRRTRYRDVVGRGLEELGELLKKFGIV